MSNIIEKVLHYPDGSYTESVLFTDLGGSQYRLEELDSSFELDFHDIVYAEERPDGDLDFVRVVERSDCEIYFNILTQEVVESTAMDRVFAEVEKLGGYADSLFIGCVYIAVPKRVNYDPWTKLRKYGRTLFRRLKREARQARKWHYLVGKWFSSDGDEGVEFRFDGTYVRFKYVTTTEAEETQTQLEEREVGRWTWLDDENIKIEESELPTIEIRVDFEGDSLSIPRPDGTPLHLSRED